MTDLTREAAPDLARPSILTVYGAAWCGDCRRAQRLLDAGLDVTGLLS